MSAERLRRPARQDADLHELESIRRRRLGLRRDADLRIANACELERRHGVAVGERLAPRHEHLREVVAEDLAARGIDHLRPRERGEIHVLPRDDIESLEDGLWAASIDEVAIDGIRVALDG